MLFDVNDLELIVQCSYYRCQFDPAHGGEMAQLEYHNFLKPETETETETAL